VGAAGARRPDSGIAAAAAHGRAPPWRCRNRTIAAGWDGNTAWWKSRSGPTPVGLHHAAHDLTLLFAHLALVVQGEVAPALDPAAHLRVIALELFVEPGELRPHLHVAQFLGAEQAARAGTPLRVARIEELAVARVAVDHVRRIGVERVLQQVVA